MKKLLLLLILLPVILLAAGKNSIEKAQDYQQNLNYDSGFENQVGWVTDAWSKWTTVSTQVGFGKTALSLAFTTSNQTSSSATFQVPNALQGQPCEVSWYTKWTTGWWNTGGPTLNVTDGTGTVIPFAQTFTWQSTTTALIYDTQTNAGITTSSINNFQTTWQEHGITFTCPTQGQVKVKIVNPSFAVPTFFIDNVYVGRSIKNRYSVSAWMTGNPAVATGLSPNYTTTDLSDANLGVYPLQNSQVGISCLAMENSIGNKTCSSGNETWGIVIEIPVRGRYEICNKFDYYDKSNTTLVYFKILERSNATWNSIINYGANGSSVFRVNGATSGASYGTSHRPCGEYFYTDPGKKTYQLYFMRSDGTATGANLNSWYEPSLWTVKYLGED